MSRYTHNVTIRGVVQDSVLYTLPLHMDRDVKVVQAQAYVQDPVAGDNLPVWIFGKADLTERILESIISDGQKQGTVGVEDAAFRDLPDLVIGAAAPVYAYTGFFGGFEGFARDVEVTLVLEDSMVKEEDLPYYASLGV